MWLRINVGSSRRTASPKARSRGRSTRPYSCALGGAAPASERTLCRAALLLGRTRLRRFRRLGLHRSLLLLVLVLLTLVTHHAVLSQGPIRGAAIGRGRVLCGFERIVRICISVYLRSIDPVTIGPARQRSLRVLCVPSLCAPFGVASDGGPCAECNHHHAFLALNSLTALPAALYRCVVPGNILAAWRRGWVDNGFREGHSPCAGRSLDFPSRDEPLTTSKPYRARFQSLVAL